MTNQEIFDIVWNGILSQGGPSIDGDGCYYRNNNGRKCAAGWLIPDDEYKKEFEGFPVIGSFLNPVYNYFQSKNFDLDFVSYLQTLHDLSFKELEDYDIEDYDKINFKFLEIWKEKMKNFAMQNNLQVPQKQ